MLLASFTSCVARCSRCHRIVMPVAMMARTAASAVIEAMYIDARIISKPGSRAGGNIEPGFGVQQFEFGMVKKPFRKAQCVGPTRAAEPPRESSRTPLVRAPRQLLLRNRRRVRLLDGPVLFVTVRVSAICRDRTPDCPRKPFRPTERENAPARPTGRGLPAVLWRSRISDCLGIQVRRQSARFTTLLERKTLETEACFIARYANGSSPSRRASRREPRGSEIGLALVGACRGRGALTA